MGSEKSLGIPVNVLNANSSTNNQINKRAKELQAEEAKNENKKKREEKVTN